jgi:hypothetical protein
MDNLPGIDPDERAEAFAARLADACCGETDADVLQELVILLAETIGHYPSAQRPVLIQAARGMLLDYVREIPPLGARP